MSKFEKSTASSSQVESGHRDTDVDDYFVGPRDLNQHSKWPIFLRLRGSVAPEMILPLTFVGAWATAVVLISEKVHKLGFDSLLLTVLGFVVGLALSFRSSTAYERYNDGRKYWALLTLTSHHLARLVWVHAEERDGELGKEDLLAKITFTNMICAFAVALKHKLRFEPFTYYDDLNLQISHLNTFAHAARVPENADKAPSGMTKAFEYLGIPMATDNPRRLIKNPEKPLGNLPLEILTHMSAFIKQMVDNGTFKAPIYQTSAINSLSAMNDVLTGCDRVLNTPLPIAYSIAIGQITWVYILLLPFQLYTKLGYVTIPATVFAAYIIVGIALIGREIEQPFGNDVNDLPLDSYCQQIRQDLDVITATEPPRTSSVVNHDRNALLWPLTGLPAAAWKDRSVDEIRAALRQRPNLALKKEFRLDRRERGSVNELVPTYTGLAGH